MPNADLPTVAVVLHDCGRDSDIDLDGLIRRSIALEAAGVAALLVRDSPLGGGAAGARPSPLEPFSLLAALARSTSTIGLVAESPASSGQPFTTARRTATLDHLSGGRSGWSPAFPSADSVVADEFLDVVTGLWDSTADDAIEADKGSGRYLAALRRRALDHHGDHFQVAGPLNLSRPPQGHPVVVIANGPEARRVVAARHADVVTIDVGDLGVDDLDLDTRNAVLDARREINAEVARRGRRASEVLVWAVAGETAAGNRFASSSTFFTHAVQWASTGVIDGLVVDLFAPGAASEAAFEALIRDLDGFATGPPPFGSTLRERLGLPRPVDGFEASA